MYIVGLTGSIGSGKSTVSKYLRSRNIKVLDADGISRELTSEGSPIVNELKDAFGAEIMDSAGNLDRRKLAEIAFSSEENKALLGELVTIKVKGIMEEEIVELEKQGEELVFLDIPLLFEYHMEESCNEVWSVITEDDIRYERVSRRDGLTREEFDLRDKAQVSQDYKKSNSRVVLYNNTTREELIDQITEELSKLNSKYGKKTQ